MFKRLAKRQQKKEEEEKLGLDDELKDVLGLNDTDSEESDSDSDQDTESEQGELDGIQGSDDNDKDNDDDDDLSDEEPSDEEEEERPPIVVREALENPLYVVSVMPNIKACVVCPAKLLKTVEMVSAHKASATHRRRFLKFSESVKDANPNSDAWLHIPKSSLLNSTTVLSKRAQKKKRALSTFQAKRERRRKAGAQAKIDETPKLPKQNRKTKRAAAAALIAAPPTDIIALPKTALKRTGQEMSSGTQKRIKVAPQRP